MGDINEQIKNINLFLAENRLFGFNRKRNPLYPEIREANPLQLKLLTAWDNPMLKTFTYTGANQIGKTTIWVILAFSVMRGEWPWSGEKISFPHTEPRKIRIYGQAWESHIKAVVEPTMRYWWPKSWNVDRKKNNQGIDYVWIDKKTKSSLEIMSNSQSSDMSEGWIGDLLIADEPMTRDHWIAASRGLIQRRGRALLCMTLLKEAWIHREIINARLPNGEPDLSVYNLNGDINVNLGYGLTQEGIDDFNRKLRDDERQARIYGKPSYMASLVCPKFSRRIHIKERFKIPLDWLIDINIDFHPSKKWAIQFMATARNNIKYICEEAWEHGNPKFIAEEIIRKVKEREYRVNSIQIDPLAKGDENNDETVFAIMEKTFASRGFSLETASKDKDNGIALLNNALWTENEMPGLFIFKDCSKTIEEIENWMYDPETLKPSKKEDDFCEVTYRNCLKNTQWYEEFTGKKQKAVLL